MNENNNDWYKELKIPKNINFKIFKNFPVFEIRLDRDKNPNGDFYLYLENNKKYYGIIKVDKNKNIKELYRDATIEEIRKYDIDTNYFINGNIFVSINNRNEITHIYYYKKINILYRKDVINGKIIQYDFYTNDQHLEKNIQDIMIKYDAKYIFTFHEVDSNKIDSYCIGLVGPSLYNIDYESKYYDYFKNNILNLENIFKS